MANVITVPVTTLTPYEKLAQTLNEIVADGNIKIKAVFFDRESFVKGQFELLVDEHMVERYERPSKFKQNVTSQFYCVYWKNGKWTYKFVRKNEKYLGGTYNTELEAALAYDRHVYEVDGHALKTNFPERLV